MGLSGAGASFQRLLEELIGDLEPYAYNYLDDIVLATATFEEHMKWLRKLILKIKGAGLTINREKSKFCCKQVKFLGFVVDERGLSIDPDKTAAVRDYPRPRTLRQLRRFIGMTSWYRKFLKDFAKITEPLIKLTKKDVKFVWEDAQEKAFNTIRELLSDAPLLQRPEPGVEFVLQTDASDTGLGAVITQKVNDTERVIAYASRALRKNEINYSTTEKECLAVKWAIEKFRPYVEGEKFTVVTDHSALKWLFDKKNATGRIGRWVQELMSHEFKVVHRKGKNNVVPDALSRIHEDSVPIQVSALQIEKITSDKWYKKRIQQIKAHPRRYRDWKIIDGRIYKYKAKENEILENLESWKLVIPSEERDKILYEAHDEPSASHPGTEKTYRNITRFYYWPGVYKDTLKYVQSCKICQQCKTDQSGQIGIMGKHEVDRPGKIISVDLIGELPRSVAGHQYVIIFIDVFTKYIICVPIKKKTATAVKNAIENVLCVQLGAPETIISDNGKEFVNKTVQTFLKESGIGHELTPTYHPQSNPVERVNRDIKTRMSAYIGDNHKNWDKYLPQFQFAHNSSVHSTTGKTPAFLTYGREIYPPKLWKRIAENNLNNDSIHDADEEENETEFSDTHKYNTRSKTIKNINAKSVAFERESNCSQNENINKWVERIQKLEHVHDDILNKIDKEKSKQENTYNKNKRAFTFQVGDVVYKKNKILSSAENNINAKLAPKYIGPYVIAKIVSDNIYVLEKEGKQLKGTCHAKELKQISSKVREYTTAEESQEERKLYATDAPIQKKRGRPKKN